MKRLVPLLVGAALLVAGCSGDGDPVVQVGEVGRTTVAETVDAPGTVGARASSTIQAPADVRVEQVLVQDGAAVEPGAVLLQLSSPSAVARLRQAQDAAAAASTSDDVQLPSADLGPLQDALDAAAEGSFAAGRAAAAQVPDPLLRAAAEQQVAEAEGRYRSAASAARRSLSSFDSGARSLEDALAALSSGQQAQAAAAVAAAQSVVDRLTVTAPIAGVVTLGGAGAAPAGGDDLAGLVSGLPEGLQAQAGAALGATGGAPSTTAQGLPVGAQVSSGSPLLTLTDVGGLVVTAEVDETDVLLVEPGQAADVELDAVPDATYPATVEAVDVTPSASAGGGVVYRVRLALTGGTTGDDAPAPRPRPGMSAVVELQVRTSPDVVAHDGRVQRVEVQLGAQGEELVEVRRGLSGGERVVVRDADRLTDGQAVRT